MGKLLRPADSVLYDFFVCTDLVGARHALRKPLQPFLTNQVNRESAEKHLVGVSVAIQELLRPILAGDFDLIHYEVLLSLVGEVGVGVEVNVCSRVRTALSLIGCQN